MARKRAKTRCDMCWKDKPVEQLLDMGVADGTAVCRGCKLDIDRIVGFLEKHDVGVQMMLRAADAGDDVPGAEALSLLVSDQELDELAARIVRRTTGLDEDPPDPRQNNGLPRISDSPGETEGTPEATSRPKKAPGGAK